MQNRNSDSLRPEQQLLTEILDKIGNPTWDLLIVGDGSGSGWDHACGWASTLVCNRYQARRFFYGAMDSGSINMAELMPYIQAISWYDQEYGKKLIKQLGNLSVHVLTDSQTIATWGNRAMSPAPEKIPRKHVGLLAMLAEFRRIGYHLQFHWAPRMSTELNWAADLMAGLTRREIMNAAKPTYVAGKSPAERAARAVQNLRFYDPETKDLFNPYQFNASNNQQ